MQSTLKIKSRACTSVVGSIVLMGVTGSLSVQANVLEEVIVTAQKREQGLQDVGIAVTAFSGEMLNKLGMTDSTELTTQTPGLEVSATTGGTNHTFSIRGVTQNDFSGPQESPTAVYIDDAYIAHNFVTGFSLFDLDRVEVLRGPQGTLFGRNSTGGLVHFITNRPSQGAEGFVNVDLGQDGRQTIVAAAGGGLTETASFRVSGIHNKGDALVKNDIGPDAMSADNYALRGQLLVEPSDSFEALIKVQYAEEDSNAPMYAPAVPEGNFDCSGVGLGVVNGTDCFGYADADGDPFTGSFDYEFRLKSTFTDASMHLNWTKNGINLSSITNYQDIDHMFSEDSDASPNNIYNYIGNNEAVQTSQEFRVNGETEKTRWIAGLYYLNIDGTYGSNQFGDFFFGPGEEYLIEADQTTTTTAAFTQWEWDLTNQMTLIAGFRLNRDEKDFDIGFQYAGDEFGVRELSFTDTDYSAKLQLDYTTKGGTLLYGGVNRGIKSGGFNLPLSDSIANDEDYQYDGETLLNYEVGMKTEINETTRLNISAYFYDYRDQQVFSFDGFVPYLFNADEGQNKGFEVELISSPMSGLDVILGAAYQDSEITVGSVSTEPALAAKWTLNGLVRYEWPAFSGSLSAQTDFSYKGDHKFNTNETVPVMESAYALFNARVGYATDNWDLSLFVKNLTDKEYRRYAYDTAAYFGSSLDIIGIPRWVGATVRYSW